MFVKHVGATPREVAGTRKVQAAKRLITDTTMPLGEVAFAAGFGSIRRFNDAFAQTYKRPPSGFRRPA
ncbi:MAG: AraC family transcriptional regulator [Rhizobiales bacterium]|nr:AraC family transcriptional regulator [Hyphomicrobiales bacterium]